MQTEAGFIYDFEQGARRLFRLGKPEDEEIYFDSKTDLISGQQGERISKMIDKEKLGELVHNDRLNALLEMNTAMGVEALEGLEPFEPTEA